MSPIRCLTIGCDVFDRWTDPQKSCHRELSFEDDQNGRKRCENRGPPSRQEVDDFISSRLGKNEEENIKHEMELSEEEGVKLSLSESTKVFGVRVIIKKAEAEAEVEAKAQEA